MAPRTGSKFYVLPHDVTREALQSIAEHDRGESIELTPEELDQSCKTGEFPERIQRWIASRS